MQFMQILTAAILAAAAGYVGAWYFGAIEGNFALLLFLATLVTGVYWLAERLYFLPRRRLAAQAIEDAAVARRAELDRLNERERRFRCPPIQVIDPQEAQ